VFVSLLKDFADLNQDAMTKKDQGSSAPRMSTIISYPSPETINLMSKDRKQAYHVGGTWDSRSLGVGGQDVERRFGWY